jgi:hypothetical protein
MLRRDRILIATFKRRGTEATQSRDTTAAEERTSLSRAIPASATTNLAVKRASGHLRALRRSQILGDRRAVVLTSSGRGPSTAAR